MQRYWKRQASDPETVFFRSPRQTRLANDIVISALFFVLRFFSFVDTSRIQPSYYRSTNPQIYFNKDYKEIADNEMSGDISGMDFIYLPPSIVTSTSGEIVYAPSLSVALAVKL